MARLDEKHVIAVWGAPGSGKSTLAVNMATILADSGYMTCLVSASDFGRLQTFFGAAIPRGKGTIAAVTSGHNVREALVEVRPNLCLLEMDTAGDSVEAIITPEHVDRILSELRDQFTYVFVDCTNYKESVFTGYGLSYADKIICCVPHEVAGAMWHISNEQFFNVLGPKTMYIDMDFKLGGTDFQILLESIQVPSCLVKFGPVKSATFCENNGKLIVHLGGREEKRYKDAVMKLIKMLLALEDEDSSAAKKALAKKAKEEKREAKRRAKEEAAEKAEAKKAMRRGGDMRELEDDDNDVLNQHRGHKPSRRQKEEQNSDDQHEDARYADDAEDEDDEIDRYDSSEDDRPRRFERETRDIEGRQKVMGTREIRRAEEAAMRRAQVEQERGYRRSDYNPDDDDDDDD